MPTQRARKAVRKMTKGKLNEHSKKARNAAGQVTVPHPTGKGMKSPFGRWRKRKGIEKLSPEAESWVRQNFPSHIRNPIDEMARLQMKWKKK